MTATNHSLHSRYRESLLEHLFAGEVMRYLWRSDTELLEVLKPQVDDGGYDLVLERAGVVRHIQLKATFSGSKVARFNVNSALKKKPGGCVIVLLFNRDTLTLGPFLWFGNAPNKPLPSLWRYPIARHTKGNAQGVKLERPNIRVSPRSKFVKLQDVSAVAERLFGPLRGNGKGRRRIEDDMK